MTDVSQNTEARQAILSSVRKHLAASAPFDAVESAHRPQKTMDQPSTAREDTLDRANTLRERFRQALQAVSGRCVIANGDHQAAQAIQRIINETKARRIAVSNATLVKRILKHLKTEAAFFDEPNQSELFDCDLGITSAQWAIAETGTLVLESDRERHRMASLVPPIHVAIIEANRIHQTMSDALELINTNRDRALSRAVTFITGPSRTADIELTTAIGVHGPGELHVIVIEDVQQAV